MKFNFRKIASVIAGTVMVSSTVALAAAANLPAPFVQNGQGNVLIVEGSNPLASATDIAAATDINAYLTNQLTQQTPSTTPVVTTNATITGANIPLYKSNDKIELGDNITQVYQSLNSQKLPTILKDGTFTGEDGTDYDYTQKIALNDAPLTYQVANDTLSPNDKPVIGFKFTGGKQVLNYTLHFNDQPANTTMATQNIDLLGKTYYISKVDVTNGDITLLDKANSAVVYEGEKATVTVGNKTYDVEIVSNTDSKATLMVNGQKLDSIDLGSSKKIAPDTYLSITDAYQGQRERDKSYVEFSIGSGKILLPADGTNVQMNENSVDDLTSTITLSSGKLSEINIAWTPADDQYLVPGSDMSMPGLNAIKLSMLGFVASNPETFRIANSGEDYLQLTNLQLGNGKVNLPILASNNSAFDGLGKDDKHVLLTKAAGSSAVNINTTLNPMFVGTYASGSNFESHLFQVEQGGINNKNETTVKDLASGDSVTIANNDNADVGDINIAVANADYKNKNATITLTHGGSAVFMDRVITKDGLAIRLPVSSSTVKGDGYLNLSAANPQTWTMNMTEADKDGNVADNNAMTVSGASSWYVTLGHRSNGPEVSGKDGVSVSMLSPDSNSDDLVGYVPGVHATKLYINDGDQRTMDVEYHGSEAYADAYLAESSAVSSTSTSTGSQSGILVVKDTDVTSSTNSNLIVVGGSCVNSVAAQLLGLTYPACGDAWQSATNVGAGSYLIQSFSRSGAIATLVAGYNAGDTTNAAMAFKTQNISTTAGTKYTGTTGSTVNLVTTTQTS